MELRTYLRPLLKWWWLILISTLLAGITSYFAVSQQPPVYQARATLLIGGAINNPNPTGNEFWLSQQLAQTYSDIAQRDVVRKAVMDELGLTWLPTYTAQSVGSTQLLEIRVNDSVPERAMVVANELANQLILRTPTSGGQQGDVERQAFIKRQLDELELKIAETNSEIVARQNELAGLFSARQISDLQDQIRALEGKQDALQANYASMLASSTQGAANSLSVIEPATLPVDPIGPEVLMTVITPPLLAFHWVWQLLTCWNTWTIQLRPRKISAVLQIYPRLPVYLMQRVWIRTLSVSSPLPIHVHRLRRLIVLYGRPFYLLMSTRQLAPSW